MHQREEEQEEAQQEEQEANEQEAAQPANAASGAKCSEKRVRFREEGQQVRNQTSHGESIDPEDVWPPQLRMPDQLDDIIRIGTTMRQVVEFPDELGHFVAEGYYLSQYRHAIEAAMRAKSEASGDTVRPLRQPAGRSLLERTCNEDICINRMIAALLEPDESACGDSVFLKGVRPKMQRCFAPHRLPDPTRMGLCHIERSIFYFKFGGDLARFFHHCVEKHKG